MSDSKGFVFSKTFPLSLQIAIALILAVVVGILFGAGNPNPNFIDLINHLTIPCNLILKALRALATPLILLAILHAFLTVHIPGRSGRKLAILLLTNTLMAIIVGLLVANLLQPGRWWSVASFGAAPTNKTLDPWGLLQDIVPPSILQPLVDNNVIQLVFVALAFGVVLRAIKTEQVAQKKNDYQPIEQLIGLLFEAVMAVLKWVIALVPIAVFGIVAKTIALQGFKPFISLAAFIVAVLIGLFLQGIYYTLRVKFGSWVSPQRFLRGGSDALLTAFSTASSTAAMPVTFQALMQKIGVRESSASLGALIGSNFNNDGTALYEAMSALFVGQLLGLHLNLPQQLMVVFTSIIASVGAAGIPEAGLVTMTLVFTAVGLPTQYIAILITVDWFLDRCRTAINVMGDMTISCLLDGKTQHVKQVDVVYLEGDLSHAEVQSE
ncbi:dicarboxylate/amino acid:cation symporter [Nostoc parmelioides]|uniref:Dicarboxylate/amino acid:cation symporter n=1 Tax=Nostoc parmelioides FACHB-3921 TaxID=2692909 RepID=A0ABR8B914_9NOSO|nr:dicarboxylate/amino acid:cation symporter [Nostoc parmelioides]MBD2250592.1 dicarboxylate/amino acid:cation symporter [Nostoc parmelioides FACHB-3921]